MPFGPYENFNACLLDQKKKGHSAESANKICGALQAKLEKKENKNQMSDLFYLFSDAKVESGKNFDPDATFELITTDKQYDTRYGNFSYSEKDLESMAKNFNSEVRGVEIAVDINHDREKKAYAWVQPKSMFVAQSQKLSGNFSLYAKLYKYTPEGMELMKTGAFRYFSLEIMPKWTRFVNGVKKVFENVIFGLALTNSPVIKDMMPTFSEDLSFNSNNMDTLKIYLASLLAKDIVTTDEKTTLKNMVAKLSEEEAEEVTEDVEKVEEKPEEAEEEEKKEEEAAEDSEEEKEEEKKKEEEKDLSEVSSKLSETQRELSEVKAELHEKNTQESAEKFILSDKVTTGFIRKDKEAVVEFVKTLSKEQSSAFAELMSKVRNVKFGELGKTEEAKDAETKEKEAQALAEKISKEKEIPKWEALSEAYDQLGMAK